MPENTSCHVSGYMAAFATGALLGGVLALIYAPRSGKETRDLISQRSQEAHEKIGEALQCAKKGVACALQEAGEAIQEKKTEFVAALEAGREAMCENMEHPDPS